MNKHLSLTKLKTTYNRWRTYTNTDYNLLNLFCFHLKCVYNLLYIIHGDISSILNRYNDNYFAPFDVHFAHTPNGKKTPPYLIHLVIGICTSNVRFFFCALSLSFSCKRKKYVLQIYYNHI